MGSHADNMHDKDLKGRSNNAAKGLPGRHNGTSKLTDEDVREIRQRIRIGRPGADGRYRGNARELALEFGVSESLIYNLRKAGWKHVL